MKKEENLLTYLKNHNHNTFTPAKELATALSVTDRMVRYYVKKINDECSGMIETSHKGYRYKGQENSTQIKEGETIEERRFSILRLLIQNNKKGLNLFDLSHQLFVSEATISSDISFLKADIKKYNLVIEQRHFVFFIKGNLKDQRKLMVDLISKPNFYSPSLESQMQKFLGNISLNSLKSEVKRVFSQHEFSFNSYFLQNFILHIILSFHQQNNYEVSDIYSGSLRMIEEITQWLNINYDISLSFEAKYELAVLCDGEKEISTLEMSEYIDPKISQALFHSLKELSTVFLIDFTDKKLLTRLLLHTQNMYNRIKKSKMKRNLSVIDIKMRYPVLFDVAIYLSSLIAADLKIKIKEDEISFLALHIGSFLDEQNKEGYLVRTRISVPNYLGQYQKVKKIIKEKFGDKLLFLSDEDNKVELLISSDKTELKSGVETVMISDFLSEIDFDRINRGITKIKQERYLTFLERVLPKLIEPDGVVIQKESMTKEALFKRIESYFVSHDYSDAGYGKELFEREKLSSTTFPSGVSIPHTIKYISKKTGFFIIIPQDYFIFDDQKVNLVISPAINIEDSQTFNHVFQRLVELLSEDYHVKYLQESSTHQELIHRIIELMISGGYYEEVDV